MVKNLRVKDEAYKYLTSLKSDSQSYSDVILKLQAKQEQSAILTLFNTEKGYTKSTKQLRAEFERDFDDRS
jgi:predicted CopG family antitoxin